MTNPLRSLPAVDAVFNHPDVEKLSEEMPRAQIIECARSILDTLRTELREQIDPQDTSLDDVVRRTVHAARRMMRRRLQTVVNATGIVLHTNLGRAPLSDNAILRLVQAARSTNVELDLETGKRSRRGAHAEDLLKSLTGAPAALIVNNCAAATMLALQGVASGREVIISRGQLVEIGGGFRLPEVFEAAGVILREVGTSNRTRLEDYERAIGDNTAAILRVHRSNFRVSGFVAEPSVVELVALARQHNLPIIDDLGSGCLTSLAPFGLDEPDVTSSLQANSDLLLFSGDKLLGGPQAGILLGTEEWIERLRKHPMARAIRIGKLTLGALEATLENHLAGNAFDTIPALNMLSIPAGDVKERCQRVARDLNDVDLDITVVSSKAEVGGGSLADQPIASFAVRISGHRPDDLLNWLRSENETPILGRIEDGAILLDLRSVLPEFDDAIVDAIKQFVREPWRTER